MRMKFFLKKSLFKRIFTLRIDAQRLFIIYLFILKIIKKLLCDVKANAISSILFIVIFISVNKQSCEFTLRWRQSNAEVSLYLFTYYVHFFRNVAHFYWIYIVKIFTTTLQLLKKISTAYDIIYVCMYHCMLVHISDGYTCTFNLIANWFIVLRLPHDAICYSPFNNSNFIVFEYTNSLLSTN